MEYEYLHKVEFYSFRLTFSKSKLRHTGVVIYVTRIGGNTDVYVHEVAGGAPGQEYAGSAPSKATMFLRKVVPDDSPEVSCRQDKPFCVATQRDSPSCLRKTLERLFASQQTFDYHLLFNNCRDQVIKFANALVYAGFSVDKSVYKHMEDTKTGDRVAAVLGIAGVLGIGYLAYKAFNPEEQEEEEEYVAQ